MQLQNQMKLFFLQKKYKRPRTKLITVVNNDKNVINSNKNDIKSVKND